MQPVRENGNADGEEGEAHGRENVRPVVEAVEERHTDSVWLERESGL